MTPLVQVLFLAGELILVNYFLEVRMTMRQLCRGLLIGCLALSFSVAAANSQKSLSEYEFEGLKERISVDLRGIDVVGALKFLATKGGLNIVASQQTSGTVHLLMEDVTVGDALETILAINRLAYDVRGNIIQVMTEQEYRNLYGTTFYDKRDVKRFQLQYVSAQNMAQMLENLKSERGEIIYNDKTGMLIVRDIPSKLEEMTEIIEASDMEVTGRPSPTKSRTFKLQYAKVDDIQGEVNALLTPEVGSIRVDKRTNTLIIRDYPYRLEEIEELISAFDEKTQEVFIEARIVQVTLNDNYKLGIDWQELAKWELPVEFIEKGVDLRHARMSLMTLENMSQKIVFDALNTFGETELLSDPRVTVQEGHEATLEVVTSEAYEAGTSEVDSGGVTTSYRNFEFVDVGVSLSVIPDVNDDGFINMLIKPEVSSIESWYGGSEGAAPPRSEGSVPVVKRSTAETTVTVKDGVTIMIAGLIDNSETQNISKVPLLGSIYGVGRLFQHHSTSTQRRETIIFLTPHIVTGDEPVDISAARTVSPVAPAATSKQIKGLRE